MSKLSRKQKSCMEMEEAMSRRHIVNRMRLPNFLPGPKILYTKSSNMGEALMSLTMRRT